jgi:hypothetical protein
LSYGLATEEPYFAMRIEGRAYFGETQIFRIIKAEKQTRDHS